MKAFEILDKLRTGALLKKTSFTKYKGNKIIRGSFYEYTIDDIKITKTQFENVRYRTLKDIELSTPSQSVYRFNI